MAKYDDEFKLAIVKAYLNGEGGVSSLAREWGLPDSKSLREWIRMYQTTGVEGLKRRRTLKDYSVQFKLDVIHFYQLSGESYLDVAVKYGISSPSLIAAWHKTFLKDDVKGLSKSRGRPTMSKNPKKHVKKMTREQELERENELLRAELAFIKKLRASGRNIPSRLLKQKPGSSKISEKDSN